MSEQRELIAQARQLDAQDELSSFRQQFYIPEDRIYMDGNSLGLLSRPAEERLLATLDEWKRLGIDGWMGADPPWYTFSEKLAEMLAPLLGATPEEIIAANSTSVNLHQILATFFRPDEQRARIIIDEYAFPTDAYAVQSHLRLHGLDARNHLVVVANRARLIEEDDILAAMDAHAGQIAMLVLPTVVYTTGQLLDIPRLTREAHQRGVLVCIDASHSIGSLPHALDAWDVDFAVWCHYKYLNAGPGAVAGLYVNRRHLGTTPGLAGWFSSDKTKQFDMAHEPTFAHSAGAYQIGTPQLLSIAPLQASLAMFHEAGIEQIRAKSLRQTRYLMDLVQSELSGMGAGIATPADDARRGGHVAVTHPEAARIAKALKRRRVVPDFRPPDIIRLSPIALYTSYEDIVAVILALKQIIEREEFLAFPDVRDAVT